MLAKLFSSSARPALRLARRPSTLLLGLGVLVLGAARIHSFLAVNRPLGRDVLIVEAWIPKEALAAVPRALQSGSYRRVLVVEYPTEEGDPNSSLDSAVAELHRLGIDSRKLVPVRVPLPATRRNYVLKLPLAPPSVSILTFSLSRRTYAAGLAVKSWLQASCPVRDVDVVTVGVHARKSWVMFQYALGSEYKVGIIAAPEPSYNPNYWLLSPRGLALVTRNLGGYLYVTLSNHISRLS